MPAFVPASSLRSTPNDLLTFLAAFTGKRKSPLAPAMRSMLDTRRPGPGFSAGPRLVGGSADPRRRGIVFHGGQTPGSPAPSDPRRPSLRIGGAVLSHQPVRQLRPQ